MKRRGTTLTLIVIIVILVAGLGYLGWKRGVFGGANHVIKDSGSNVSDYSAVFLTNDQVYFGKINSEDGQEVQMSDIYYLKVNQQIQPNQTGTATPTPTPDPNSSNIVLVKLGDELHGPNDLMHINRQQILFIESMKSDSKVVKAIDANKNK